jgi:YVTN family beta-propeller protein
MFLLGLVGAACLVGAAPAAASPFVYVSSFTTRGAFMFDAAGGPLSGLGPITVSAGNGAAGVAVTPDGTSVYIADAVDNTVSQYDAAANGVITPKSPATVKAGQFPLEIAVNPDGKAAYAVNANDNTVSQYDIGPGGALSSTVPAKVAAGGLPSGVAVSPNGKSVYVANCNGNTVSQYSVGAGDTLAPKTAATVAAGSCPRGVAVSPDGKRAYVTDFKASTVSQYDIGADGALTPKTPATVPAGQFPIGIAVSPDSQSVYVADSVDGNIAQYAAAAGGLVLKTPQTIGAGDNPTAVGVTPDGKNVYATDFHRAHSGGGVFQYSGGSGPGTLSPLTPPTVAAGVPNGIAVGPTRVVFRCVGVIAGCITGIVPLQGGGPSNAVIIRATLVRAAPVGILVQRIVGKHRARVGLVPLGLHRTGPARIRWNLRVNGHKLHKGRYLITLRMFDRGGHLIALAHPVAITVR